MIGKFCKNDKMKKLPRSVEGESQSFCTELQHNEKYLENQFFSASKDYFQRITLLLKLDFNLDLKLVQPSMKFDVGASLQTGWV